jgi:hypothetical protein
MDALPRPAGKVCPKLIACKVTGLPGARHPIEGRRTRDLGQAACPTRALRPARQTASTANPSDSARTAVSSPSEAMTRLGSPPGSAGCAGMSVGWCHHSPTWPWVGVRRAG